MFTDISDASILSLIEANLAHNKEFIKSEVVIKPLDFMDLQWSPDLEQLVASSDVILAADGNVNFYKFKIVFAHPNSIDNT